MKAYREISILKTIEAAKLELNFRKEKSSSKVIAIHRNQNGNEKPFCELSDKHLERIVKYFSKYREPISYNLVVEIPIIRDNKVSSAYIQNFDYQGFKEYEENLYKEMLENSESIY